MARLFCPTMWLKKHGGIPLHSSWQPYRRGCRMYTEPHMTQRRKAALNVRKACNEYTFHCGLALPRTHECVATAGEAPRQQSLYRGPATETVCTTAGPKFLVENAANTEHKGTASEGSRRPAAGPCAHTVPPPPWRRGMAGVGGAARGLAATTVRVRENCRGQRHSMGLKRAYLLARCFQGAACT